MFYEPKDGHGLPHNPFNALVAPRPIGWISSTGSLGDNLAPYSFFNATAYVPPQIMFASQGVKDSLLNIRETGVFCVNLVGEALMQAMSDSSAALPRGQDEFLHTGLAKAPSRMIAAPRVAAAPAALECRMTEILTLKGRDNYVVLAEVVGIHIDDACLSNGKFDATLYHPVARMGYRDYTVIRDIFELKRPDD